MATALALRYARAFADVAESAKLDSDAAQSQLHDFAETAAGSRDLRELLENPSIEQASKIKVLDAIAKRMGMFAQVRNFLAVIIEHGRLAELNDILEEYREMADADSACLTDFEAYPPSLGAPAAFVASPIDGRSGPVGAHPINRGTARTRAGSVRYDVIDYT